MKILNLYAGIGGNRKLWGEDHEVTAVEIDKEIAAAYSNNFPNDTVIIADAHQYLLDHYKEFDFIWGSPPCPTHSKLRHTHEIKIYANMNLYQEIIFLKHWFKGKWVIENVEPYYDPLITPNVKLGRNVFWNNFYVHYKEFDYIEVSKTTKEQLSKDLNMEIPEKNARLLLRNCVKPEMGLHILNYAIHKPQKTLLPEVIQ